MFTPQEIDITKAERIIRKHFEELERTEREVFSELSSALRFSHEKERAQNEKTKYWSIVGSIVGASTHTDAFTTELISLTQQLIITYETR